MNFIDVFQQVSMHHIYNDIFHQAAVSQSFSNIRINIKSFMFSSYTQWPRTHWFQQSLDDDVQSLSWQVK